MFDYALLHHPVITLSDWHFERSTRKTPFLFVYDKNNKNRNYWALNMKNKNLSLYLFHMCVCNRGVYCTADFKTRYHVFVYRYHNQLLVLSSTRAKFKIRLFQLTNSRRTTFIFIFSNFRLTMIIEQLLVIFRVVLDFKILWFYIYYLIDFFQKKATKVSILVFKLSIPFGNRFSC